MNIAPQELIGKVVKDCYQDRTGKVVIEFTDGTTIEVVHEEYYQKGHEVSIRVII